MGLDGRAHDYYVRQMWDWKISADLESMPPRELTFYAEMCAWTLARAHARSGDRITISAYLGKGDTFDQAVFEFSVAYADQNERDYQTLVEAVKSSRIKAETGYIEKEFTEWRLKQKQKAQAILPNVISGLATGLFSIPEGMAYAQLAGVNPVYGMYSGIVADDCVVAQHRHNPDDEHTDQRHRPGDRPV